MQITPNMPQIIVNFVQFLDKLTKYNVPFYATSIQTNYHIIAQQVRKYYDKEGKEYDSTILEHINRNDGRMGSAYDALVRRNIVTPPDEWDIAKLNDLNHKIKEVLNFLNRLTSGQYSEDTLVYCEYRESRGKIFDNKSKLIYLHIPTMIKLVIDPQVNPKYNLCDIVTCYTLSSYKSIQDEFNNCSLPYTDLDLSSLFVISEESRAWKNFLADATRISAKKVVEKPKKVVTLKNKVTSDLDTPVQSKTTKKVITLKTKVATDFEMVKQPKKTEAIKPTVKATAQVLNLKVVVDTNISPMRDKSYKYGYVNYLGNFVIQPIFEEAQPFSEGIALIKIEGKYGFIKADGTYLFKPIFDTIYQFFTGIAMVQIKGKYGFIKEDGTYIFKPILDNAWDFKEGTAMVKIGGKYGFIKVDGTYLIQPIFDGAWEFTQGIAMIEIGGKYGYIKPDGTYLFKPIFDVIYKFSEGSAKIKIGKKIGFIKTDGTLTFVNNSLLNF